MNDDRIPAYNSWPFYWLTRAHGRYQDALSSALAGTGLDATSWRILMILKEQEWTAVSDIASQANSKLSTMTKAVQRMQAAGLVTFREGTRDRRVTEVALTPHGSALLPVASETARHVYDRAFAGMPPKRLALLRELLEDVANNLR